MERTIFEFSGKPNRAIICEQLEKVASKKKHNLCLIVMPPFMKNDYPAIKVQAARLEMLTQVMIESHLRNRKGLRSIATKILLQIIAKRGNTLWTPKSKFTPSDTMLVGFETAKAQKGHVLGACATINSTFSSIYSCHCNYEGVEDKFQAMVKLSVTATKAYMDRNKKTPKEAVVFMNTCPADQIRLYH